MKKRILSLLLAAALLLCLTPSAALAGTEDITVYVTVSDKGSLAVGSDSGSTLMANVPVSVPDAGDGKNTVDAVLSAVHELYCADGYAQKNGTVKKLWGVETTNTLFFVNGAGLSTGVTVDTVSDGDYFTASVNKDDAYYADWYGGFDANEKTVLAGAEFSLTLKGHLGMAWEEAAKLDAALSGISIGTAAGGTFTPLEGKVTDADGSVTLSFQTPGTYAVSASGTVSATVTDWSLMDLGNNTGVYGKMDFTTYDSFVAYTDADHGDGPYPADEIKYVDFFEWNDDPSGYHILHNNQVTADCPIIAPVCVVTVVSKPTVELAVTEADGGAVPESGYTYHIEAVAAGTETVTELKVTPETDVAGGTYTYQWRYKTAPDAGSSSTAAGTRTKAVYTPPVSTDSVQYYYCKVTYKLGGASYTAESALVPVTAIAGSIQTPVISAQPAGGTYPAGSLDVAALTVGASKTGSGTLSYQWYASRDGGAFEAVAGADSRSYAPFESAPCTLKLYCKVTNSLESVGGNSYVSSVRSDTAEVVFKSMEEYGAGWQGSGTEAAPYLIANQADAAKLSELSSGGMSFTGTHFKLTANIELPEGWVPVGVESARFAGVFDGGGFTVTVPENGLPLFGYVRGAAVSDLCIYGKKIASSGLVAYYTVDSGVSRTIDIINCTLKAGSCTLYSGFIGGYASGTNAVTIRGCTVEKDVVIGYDKSKSGIGSFGGEFNGYVSGCVSYASVYGVNNIGGIVGVKGQSMGPCDVHDCEFYGTVEATGNYAGGIIGAGYISASAPQTPCVSIRNCLVTGSVIGADKVGGIFGGEGGVRETWGNGVGYIQNNLFTGTVSASADGGVSGGVIGYMRSLGRYNVISNNYYIESCGVSAGIGEAVVTTLESPAVTEGNGWTAVNLSAGTVYGRGDDPMGAGADALAAACTASRLADGTVVRALNSGLNSSGDWVQNGSAISFGGRRHLLAITCQQLSAMNGVTAYINGDSVLKGKTLTLTYSDGSTESLDAARAVCDVSLTDAMADTTLSASAVYNNHQLVFRLNAKAGGTVTDPEPGDTGITVTFSLLGDTKHSESAAAHTLKGGNLKTWIAPYAVTAEAGATVMDIFAAALNAKGYSWMNDDAQNGLTGNYIQSIATPAGAALAEFDNGANSGWMYTLNGVHTLLGVSEQPVKNGDVIVFHYSDDYTAEQGSESWTGGAAAAPAAPSFDDVSDGDWFASAVSFAVKRGLFDGVGDKRFDPSGSMTRSMLATVLYRLAGEPDAGAESGFSDVPGGQWYTAAVAWAKSSGIAKGYDNGLFGLAEPITREQLAVMLMRFSEYMRYGSLSNKDADILGFGDAGQVSAYAVEAMRWAYGAGIVQGGSGLLAPVKYASRAETAAMLMRFIELAEGVSA